MGVAYHNFNISVPVQVSKLRNSARSVQRTIVNNFMDSSKQEAIDLLLLNGYAGEIGMLTRSLLKPADLLGKTCT